MARVLIVGGGIGGLAAALALAGRGHHIVVLERNAEFTEMGAGIQLAPNAFHALDLLGVGQPVRERAVFIDELRFMDGTTGERVASMPLGTDYRARFGNPYAVVHRGDLYQPLVEMSRSTEAIELRAGSPVVRYDQDAAGVSVTLSGGGRIDGDVLVGADGIRSVVRRQMLGDGEPRVSGHTIYRCLIPMAQVPEELRWNTVTLWAGPDWHLVHYPIASGRYLNFAATRNDGAPRAVVGVPVGTGHVRGQFPGLCDTARRLLRLGDGWRTWVLCDRDPAPGWTDGRVVLIGDAAHPMLQYAAQGACMALEDAVVLGELLDCSADEFAQRLQKFTAVRRERTAKAQYVAREMGNQLYHPAGEAARTRNKLLRALSVTDLYDKVSWLHGARDMVNGWAA